jgi:hypothetical protein
VAECYASRRNTVRRTGPRRATCAPRRGRAVPGHHVPRYGRRARAAPGHAERRVGSTQNCAGGWLRQGRAPHLMRRGAATGPTASARGPNFAGQRPCRASRASRAGGELRARYIRAMAGRVHRAGGRGEAARAGAGCRAGSVPRVPGRGRARRATDAASRGQGRRRGERRGRGGRWGGSTRRTRWRGRTAPGQGLLQAARATWGGERDARRGGEGDQQGTTAAMTSGSHQGGGGCNRPRTGNGGEATGPCGASWAAPAGWPKGERGGQATPGGTRASQPKTGWAAWEGKEEGGSRPRLGQKERGRDFPSLFSSYFSYYLFYL